MLNQYSNHSQTTIPPKLDPENYTTTAMYGDLMVANNIEILHRLVASDLIKKYGTSNQFKAKLLDGKGNTMLVKK